MEMEHFTSINNNIEIIYVFNANHYIVDNMPTHGFTERFSIFDASTTVYTMIIHTQIDPKSKLLI